MLICLDMLGRDCEADPTLAPDDAAPTGEPAAATSASVSATIVTFPSADLSTSRMSLSSIPATRVSLMLTTFIPSLRSVEANKPASEIFPIRVVPVTDDRLMLRPSLVSGFLSTVAVTGMMEEDDIDVDSDEL